MERLPNDVEFKAEEGGVILSLNDNGEEATYSAVELVAMVLSSAQVCFRAFVFGDKKATTTTIIELQKKSWTTATTTNDKIYRARRLSHFVSVAVGCWIPTGCTFACWERQVVDSVQFCSTVIF